MPTYTLIASTITAGSQTAVVNFDNIPQTYTDLVLRCSARGNNNGAATDNLCFYINNSSASNYSAHALYSNGSGTTSQYNTTGQTVSNWAYTANGSTAGASLYGGTEFYIPNYTSNTTKVWYTFGGVEQNTQTNAYILIGSGRWNLTNAITRIEFQNLSSTYFVANSSFQLYGISNA